MLLVKQHYFATKDGKGIDLDVEITCIEFEKAIAPLLERARVCIRKETSVLVPPGIVIAAINPSRLNAPISDYYRIGPIAASYIKKHQNVKKLVAFILGNIAKYLPNTK
ncbi:MAG: hypothetical protein V7K47_11515 [Nostoc sp.]